MNHTFAIGGFDEAVLIVRSPEPHLACWRDAGGWVLQHQGEVDPCLLRGWGLPVATGREWRLGHRNGSVGHVRLMQLDKAGPQADMRADDQCWDAGGIFDLNVRVRDVAVAADALHALHWHGASPKLEMRHLAMQEDLDGKHVQWMEHVTDEQYGGPVASND